MPEFAKEWVAALRSGKYKQCRCVLNNTVEDSFCTIGVACELAHNKGLLAKELPSSLHVPYAATYDGCRTSPPDVVMDLLQLDERSASVLINLNDNGEHSFNAIASEVEQLYASL